MLRLFMGVCAALLLTGCGGGKEPAGTAETNAAAAEMSPLSAPTDYLKAIDKGQKSAEKTVDTAALNKAIQLFNIEEGRNPSTLQELVEKQYLPRIPEAPYGMKLQYDGVSGTVKITRQ
jgi:hypothetical protein